MIKNKVLLIGGAGFIGYETAKLLNNNNYEVFIVDNFSTSAYFDCLDNFSVFKIDAQDLDKLSKVYQEIQPDIVFIFSSFVDVYPTIKNPLLIKSGILTTMNALRLSQEFNVKLNIYASSGFVYGNINIVPYKEDDNVDPINPYNISKIYCENLIDFYFKHYSQKTIILRYAPTYGPRRNIGPIYDFIKKASDSLPITTFGHVTRDYIYVEDVALANMLVLKVDWTKNEIINIGTGLEYDLNTIYNEICTILNLTPLKIIEHETKLGEINRFCLDVKKSKNLLGNYCIHNLNQGLTKTINSFKNANFS
jgi:nucleoside-diphosphate-sugar epimerase